MENKFISGRDFIFIGKKLGKTNQPVRDKDGLTPLDHVFKDSCVVSSISDIDKRSEINGDKTTL